MNLKKIRWYKRQELAPNSRTGATIMIFSPLSDAGHLNSWSEIFVRRLLALGFHVQYIAPNPNLTMSGLIREQAGASPRLEVLNYHASLSKPSKLALSVFISRFVKRAYNKLDSILPIKSISALFADIYHSSRGSRTSNNNKGLAPKWFAIRVLAALEASKKRPSLVINMYMDLYENSGDEWAKFDELMPVKWVALTFAADDIGIPEYVNCNSCLGVMGIVGSKAIETRNLYHDKYINLIPDLTLAEKTPYEQPAVTKLRFRAERRKIIIFCGAITARKNVDGWIHVIRHADPKTWYFAQVGKIYWNDLSETTSLELRRLMSDEVPNFYCLDEYINDERLFNDFVAMSDYIYAVYISHQGSSNMISKSALFRKPLLVDKSGYLGKVVTDYGIGSAIDGKDHAKILAGLDQLGPVVGEKFDAWLRDNSASKLDNVLLELAVKANIPINSMKKL